MGNDVGRVAILYARATACQVHLGTHKGRAGTPTPIREEQVSLAGRWQSDGLPMVAGRPGSADRVGTGVVAGARGGNAVVMSAHPGSQRLNCGQEAHTRRGQLIVDPRGNDRGYGAPDQAASFEVT